MTTTIPRSEVAEELTWAWKVADDLDSNHGRWVILELADRLGFQLSLPPVNEPNNRLREQLAEAQERIERAVTIIETADNRAMATDGPVGHVRDEMSDDEWRQLYVALVADPSSEHGSAA